MNPFGPSSPSPQMMNPFGPPLGMSPFGPFGAGMMTPNPFGQAPMPINPFETGMMTPGLNPFGSASMPMSPFGTGMGTPGGLIFGSSGFGGMTRGGMGGGGMGELVEMMMLAQLDDFGGGWRRRRGVGARGGRRHRYADMDDEDCDMPRRGRMPRPRDGGGGRTPVGLGGGMLPEMDEMYRAFPPGTPGGFRTNPGLSRHRPGDLRARGPSRRRMGGGFGGYQRLCALMRRRRSGGSKPMRAWSFGISRLKILVMYKFADSVPGFHVTCKTNLDLA
ncbi:hypothetical protein B0A48_11358 [Cryoendolithus antarcticus]|uniref:Uncharacterized protein n=1 Tax=Cryoendolithus antarcticus TaxID=1507870 RepID=A0A1V8SVC2_9PEZI|nr:hypothetical protein B0A48_11358 [Cryoendolithus antarcticus]